MINRYLSIWEIAHRWRDTNPDKHDSIDLPVEVQDTLRYICRGILDGKLNLHKMDVFQISLGGSGSQGYSEIRPQYVDEHPIALEDCLYRKYDKKVLDTHFIDAEELFDYCLSSQSYVANQGLDFPDFWTGQVAAFNVPKIASDDIDPVSDQPQAQRLRPAQIDKLVCQAIASTLWGIYPTMTITAMTEHSSILGQGGGKLYKGKNTLRDWLSEVAPDAVRKPGRPKTPKPSIDAA